MFILFNTLAEFNTWHDQVKIDLGLGSQNYTVAIPHPTNDTVICGFNNQVNVSSLNLITKNDAILSGYINGDINQALSANVIAAKEFANDLLQRLKEKNLSEGLDSIDKSAWVHHRLRKVPYTLSDNTTVVEIDVLNLVVSGDIETAESVLGQMSVDSMQESYHWLTQERIDWIRDEIRKYLGWETL